MRVFWVEALAAVEAKPTMPVARIAVAAATPKIFRMRMGCSCCVLEDDAPRFGVGPFLGSAACRALTGSLRDRCKIPPTSEKSLPDRGGTPYVDEA
ncbi:hypothetical protein Aple_027710 [Acrocarpospora pleiomorpha]|uniref:Uncharacterized protein n=1 Tax=Acrocarpospora pleiomorpha TaxID=90975 RepID=A0A5M3XE42_9ACTN|nr:hypothetical protein Aple_027710 [Acrocarpospora pleiomorpha]